ncbi:MAG: hypothetical protein HPY84_04110 [Syntrophobacteraceae bacterium]|jgi:hypothetical protein|nr:hypothetical protein [Syntrophobacteraceae bacterium]
MTAMDGMTLDAILKIISNFGIPGMVLVIWYFSEKSHERTLKQYREDMMGQRMMYEDGMQEIRRMYENNVELVKNYASLAGNLKDVVMINTRSWQRVSDDVNRNQFCPMVRLKKDAVGVQP